MFPFMTTSQPLAQSHIQQTLFAVDFLAKTSAQQVNKRASKKALGLASFTNSSESFAWYDHGTSSWRTSLPLFPTGSTPYLGSWPKQGLTANGRAYQQVLWAPVTEGIGGGLLPTPRANSAMTVDLRTQQGRPELHPNLETVMARMLPTPTTRDWKDGSQQACQNVESNGLLGREIHRAAGSAPTGDPMYLNPSFVEEMMGFPVGWTALKP
jgi:hypothetical protein